MRSDTEIRRLVIHELTWRPSLRDESIGVTVKDGVVTLTGTVQTFASKYQAEHATQRVPGVLSIASDLDIKPPRRLIQANPYPKMQRLAR